MNPAHDCSVHGHGGASTEPEAGPQGPQPDQRTAGHRRSQVTRRAAVLPLGCREASRVLYLMHACRRITISTVGIPQRNPQAGRSQAAEHAGRQPACSDPEAAETLVPRCRPPCALLCWWPPWNCSAQLSWEPAPVLLLSCPARFPVQAFSADGGLRCSAARYPLQALLHDCREYMKATGRRPTFEYTLLDGVNDGLVQVCGVSPALPHQLCQTQTPHARPHLVSVSGRAGQAAGGATAQPGCFCPREPDPVEPGARSAVYETQQ